MTTYSELLPPALKNELLVSAEAIAAGGDQLRFNPVLLSSVLRDEQKTKAVIAFLRDKVEQLPSDRTVRPADPALFKEQQLLPRPRLHFVVGPSGMEEGMVAAADDTMTLYSLDEDQGLRKHEPASPAQAEFNRQQQARQAQIEAARQQGRQTAAAFGRNLLRAVQNDIDRSFQPGAVALAKELLKGRDSLDVATAAAICSVLGTHFGDLVVQVGDAHTYQV